jgi:amino acid transporter
VSKDFKPKLKKPKFKEDLEIAVTLLIMISVFYGLTYFGVDKILSTAIVALLGIFMEVARQVFSQAIFIIQSIPYIGPVVAKVIVWPFFITINAVAYLVTLTFIRIRGVKEVANAKLLTTVFLIGILLGFILGRVVKII